ncbi:MAG: rhodanese-related sulfurtransferase [Chloroflexota bacterium]
MSNQFVIFAYYKFVDLPDYKEIQPKLLAKCEENEVKGTILLAPEGINGTMAGPRVGIDAVLAFLRADPRMADLSGKESYGETNPFRLLKVRLKKEIVALGREDVDPNKQVGTYVEPQEWNDLISNPDVTLVDTRNEYEFGVGTFKGALNPHTYAFNQFPEYVSKNLDPQKNKKVAMFCTGGIRCEKATSLLLEMGFEEVYHLHGGILQYLEDVPKEESLWEGDCFVFDSRITVNHDLEQGDQFICHVCERKLTPADKAHKDYHIGVSCPHCINQLDPVRQEAYERRMAQVREMQRKG